MRSRFFILFVFFFVEYTAISQNKINDSLKKFNLEEIAREAKQSNLSNDEYDFFIKKRKREFINNEFGIKPIVKEDYRPLSLNSLPAINIDFEQGNFNGWTLSSGTNANSFNSTSGFPSPGNSILVGPGTDPIVGLSTSSPLGGNWVARVNYTVTGSIQNKIRNKINVTPNTNLLKFAYAAVLNKSGHFCEDQGYFAVLLKDTVGKILFKYFVQARDTFVNQLGCQGHNQTNLIDFGTASGAYYSNWAIKCVDLSSYIGRNIFLEVIGGDCTLSAHWGYGYFDAKLESCPDHGTPNNLIINNQTINLNENYLFCGNPSCTPSLNITAPSWPTYFNWNGPAGSSIYSANQQSITTSFNGLYTLSMGNNSVCPITKSFYLSNLNIAPAVASYTGMLCVNTTYTFTEYNANSYAWSNGQQGQTCIITPTLAGTYSLAVTKTNVNGCSSTSVYNFTINNVPNVIVSGPATICNGNIATYSATGANTYQWFGSAVGPTTVSAVGQNVSFTPTINTNYTLTATDAVGCSSKTEFSVAVKNTIPAINATSNFTSVCPGQPAIIYLTNASPTYTLNDGVTTFTTNYAVSVSPTLTTTYTITSSNVCNTVTKTLTIYSNTTVPSVSLSLLTPVCSQGFLISASGGSLYTVYTPSSSTITASSNTINIPQPVSAGIYTVLGQMNAVSCSGSQTINIGPVVPTPTISFSPFPVCVGPTTINASGAAAYTLEPWVNTGPAGPTFTTSGTFTANVPSNMAYYNYTAIGANGCVVSGFYSFPSVPPITTVNISASNQTVCAGGSVTLTAIAFNGYNYLWSTGQTGYQAVVSPTATTIYSVTNSNSCSAFTQTIAIYYVNVPAATIPVSSSNYTPCANAPFTLSASGVNSYTWSNSFSNSSTVTASVAWPNAEFFVQGFDNNGCVATGSITIANYITPVTPTVVGNYSICPNTVVSYSAIGLTTYSWSTGSATNTTGFGPFPGPGFPNYTLSVKGIDINGCPTPSAIQGVTVISQSYMTFASTSTICPNTSTLLVLNPAFTSSFTSFLWSNGSTTNSTIVTPSTTTIYSLTGTYSSLGCTSTATISVPTFSNTSISLTLPFSQVCEGDSSFIITTNPANASVYSHPFNSGINNIFYPSSPGTYSLNASLVDVNGCFNTSPAQTLIVHPKPAVSFNAPSTNFCLNSTSVALAGSPAGGIFSGVNVAGSNYIPNVQSVSSVIYNYTSSNGCKNYDQQCFVVSNCTGIDQNYSITELSVYPNPFEADFFIRNNNGIEALLDILTVDGKLIYHSKIINSQAVDMKNYSPGIYFVRLTYEGQQKVFKLVKN